MPERQHTLRATVEWSVGLLEEAERSLLEILAIFMDGWTLEAAAEVAGLEEDRALELSEALDRHSLVYFDRTGLGPRLWYLTHDRAPLPHLFRVLWMYWGLRDHLGEARTWVDSCCPPPTRSTPRPRLSCCGRRW